MAKKILTEIGLFLIILILLGAGMHGSEVIDRFFILLKNPDIIFHFMHIIGIVLIIYSGMKIAKEK